MTCETADGLLAGNDGSDNGEGRSKKMTAKTRIVLRLLLAIAVLAALVPTAALAQSQLDDYDGW